MNKMISSSRGNALALGLALALLPLAGLAQADSCWQNSECWGDRLQLGVTTSAEAEALLGAEQRRIERNSELSSDNKPIHYESWYYSAANAPPKRGMWGGLRQAANSALGAVGDVGTAIGGNTGNAISQRKTGAALDVGVVHQRVTATERLAGRAGLNQDGETVGQGAPSLRLSFRDGVLVSVSGGG
ncbi:hypothetical protein [Luteimonas sp. 3794]|uniref:hypothetical protein n=1 Tax=Luteimonas sp. 3794 TaxID=2817730 RepID=UPI002856F645|nr:hypothetical protein [Luteimonas sp. 3794]MDR6990213.1 hypothetical protein [Luteimonas sp. 3794]